MSIFQLCAGAIGVLLIYLFFKNAQEKFASMLLIAGGILILLFVVQKLPPLLTFADQLAEYAHINETYFSSVLKSLAVCYLGELTAGACKDFGVAGWGEKIELACRCSLLIIALPLFEDFLSLLTEMLK